MPSSGYAEDDVCRLLVDANFVEDEWIASMKTTGYI